MFPLRSLLTRRWLLSIVLALAFAVIAVMLGNWQFGKHQDKVERRDIINANYSMDPVALSSVLGVGESLVTDDEWTRVELTGAYRTQDQLLVRNRPYRGVFGYEVLVPFGLSADQVGAGEGAGADDGAPVREPGPLLLIDRGWVPNAESAATLPEVPTAPSGDITVTGWLRNGEEDLNRELPDGQVASINLRTAQQALGTPLYQAYVLLEEETPAPSVDRPAAADPPDTGIGVHLAYALQWWLTAPVGLLLIWVMARREWRDQHEPTSAESRLTEAGDDASPADSDSAVVLSHAGAPAKARKRRIWDEEDG